jgi:ubiquinone/menaquinone biosynthesis C-methylase UbiE
MHLESQDRVSTVELLSTGSWVTLSYVEDSGCLFLMSAGHGARWPSEILRNGEAVIRHEGGTISGRVELVSNREKRESIIEMFRLKYGDEKYNRWFSPAGRVVKVTPSFTTSGGRETYYKWLESEFDSVAHDYDEHITGNSINMLLRERSLTLMKDVFCRSNKLLEIGCGSGMETLPLLKEGHDIVAVDISSEMLDIVRKKAADEGLSDHLITRKIKASEIESLVSEFGEGHFDGCYSTYGALNCEQTLSGIPEAIHVLLRRNGKFVAGIYNKYCLSEIIGYGLSFRFKRIMKRAETPVREGDSRFCIDVYSYSVPEVAKIFSRFFTVDRVIGVPVILPPSDLDAYARKFSNNSERLNAIDLWLGKRWPLSALGDHFLMVLKKKDRRSD